MWIYGYRCIAIDDMHSRLWICYALRSGGRRVTDGGICKQRPRVSPKAIQIPP